MMNKSKISTVSLVIAIILSIIACSSSQKKLVDKIQALEKEMYNESNMAPKADKAREIISLYIKYADEYPSDTISASYLFKAADVSSKINETHQAIELFSRFLQNYPDHRNAPYALFLQGFIYENQVGDPMKAKPYYESFLKTYPDHPMAGDVSFSLENLGKSPEELIQQFESKMKSDSTQVPADSMTISDR